MTLSNASRLAEEAVGLLASRRRTVAVAEASSGGLIGHLLTDVPGSSSVFLGGVIAYANALKERLGVPAETIASRGAVSAEVAIAMAEAVRQKTGAGYGLAVTGVAGPGGGTSAKPVGLTFVALSSASGVIAREHRFGGGRSAVKAASAAAALDLLIEAVQRETRARPA